MKKNIKNFIGTAILATSVVGPVTQISAYGHQNSYLVSKQEVQEVPEILVGSYTHNFLSSIDLENLVVHSQNGDIVSENLLSTLKDHLIEKEFNEIVRLIFKYDLILSVTETTNNPLSRTISAQQNFRHLQSHTQNSTDGRWTIQALTTLTGVITVNANGTVTTHGSPTLTVEANMGAGWSVTPVLVSTGFSGSTAWGNFGIDGSFFHANLNWINASFRNMRTSIRL